MIVIICGPAGVGKTTVATELRERLAERGCSFRMLHSDQFSRNTYDRMYERVENSDDDWLLDGTFYKREWLRRFRALDDAVVVYLEADLETCLERNRERDDPIEERAVHIIWYEFEEPNADVTIDATRTTPERAVERILRELRPVLTD
ncbi:AAA family ATPase [Haladaptatus halobius]|uniref:AAA family ATPase n=1 Tax=Haladaptatus halobius TaxID=2884875 RepID=UPI001D0BC2EE|nr:AAA family ATPase [Haladaptatus halobius]